MTPQELIDVLLASETFIDNATRANHALLADAPSDEARRRVMHLVGRAWSRTLDEAFGEEGGLVLAAVFFDGLMDRWSRSP
jgi:hypothetical protein